MAKKSKMPEVTFENGRWAVGIYSTSVPGKLVNHLRKRYGVEISIEDVMALAAPVATAVTEPPEPPDDNKEI
ncbi:MAG: hypothetical protein KDK05_32495 [Candidatus Competibacteraceae bacterium]|nr:hypothetical protein [Candidatus Competibacteraceae bacterium]